MIKKVRSRGKPRWRVLYRDVDGSQRSKTFDRAGEAREFEALMVRRRREARDTGLVRRPKRMSFERFVQECWLPDRCTESFYAPKTVEASRCFLAKWVLGERIGKLPMPALHAGEMNRWIAEMHRKGLKPSTIKQRMGLVRMALTHAVKLQAIERMPFQGSQLEFPAEPPQSRRAWTAEEISAFLARCSERQDGSGLVGNHPLRTAFLLALKSGLRYCEQMALQWRDVDLERRQVAGSSVPGSGVISCTKQIRWLPLAARTGSKGWEFRPPKSPSAIREVDVSPELRRELLEHRLRTPHDADGDFVISSPAGDPYGRSGCALAQAFRRERRECGLEGRVWHELRHTFGSILLSLGAPIDYVATQLGHSSISTTADIYQHQLRKSRPEQIALLDRFLESG